MADGRLRGLVATASLDLGIDWGDVDLVVQMGAPKGSSRLLQRIGRANHRLDEPSKGIIVPGNRFEYLEARAALDAIDDGELDPEIFRPGALDVLAQHILAMAVAGAVPAGRAARRGPLGRALCRAEGRDVRGGPQLHRHRRLCAARPTTASAGWCREPGGMWRIAKPSVAQQHRLNAGVIVEQPLLDRPLPQRPQARHDRGRLRLDADARRPLLLRRPQPRGRAVQGHRHHRPRLVQARRGSSPTAAQRMSMSTHLANRVRAHARATATTGTRFPDDVREWLEVQIERSVLPEPHQLLVETFPHEGQHYMVAYSFEGWNAHQSLGMLITRRMESAGLKPLGFVANDYALACYGLEPITDPERALLAPTSSSRSSSTGSRARTC